MRARTGLNRIYPAGGARRGAARITLLTVLLVIALAVPSWALPAEQADDTFPDTDGHVFAIAVVGDLVYVGGDFSRVGGQPRSNLAAIDARTGALTSWNPGANRPVYAMAAASDGSLFIGGKFSRVAGERHRKVARIDAAGDVVSEFDPVIRRGRVQALAVSEDVVYVGGRFTEVNGELRPYLAALDVDTGDVLNWNPAPDAQVWDLELDAGNESLWVGGKFSTVGGVDSIGIVELQTSDGSPTAFRSQVRRAVFDLALSSTRLFLAAGGGGGAVIGYAVDKTTGDLLWVARTDGDMQAIDATETTVYAGGHQSLIEGQPRANLAALDAATGAVLPWDPGADGGKGPYEIVITDRGLIVGGQFTRAGGESRGGLVRFLGTP